MEQFMNQHSVITACIGIFLGYGLHILQKTLKHKPKTETFWVKYDVGGRERVRFTIRDKNHKCMCVSSPYGFDNKSEAESIVSRLENANIEIKEEK